MPRGSLAEKLQDEGSLAGMLGEDTYLPISAKAALRQAEKQWSDQDQQDQGEHEAVDGPLVWGEGWALDEGGFHTASIHAAIPPHIVQMNRLSLALKSYAARVFLPSRFIRSTSKVHRRWYPPKQASGGGVVLQLAGLPEVSQCHSVTGSPGV